MSQREHIIEQAAQMFAELGVKSIRMDDIAQSLGVSKRTLYELFADKEELLYLCMDYLHREQIDLIERECGTHNDKMEALFIGFRVMLSGAESHHRMMSNLQKFYPAVFERLRLEHAKDGMARLRRMLVALVDAGLIERSVNIDLSVTIFYYTVTVVFGRQNNMTLPDGVTQKDALMYSIVNFFRGIATVEGVRRIDKLKEQYKIGNIERKLYS